MCFEFDFEKILRRCCFLNKLKNTINTSNDSIIEKIMEKIAFFINLFNHIKERNKKAIDMNNESIIMANFDFIIIKLLSF